MPAQTRMDLKRFHISNFQACFLPSCQHNHAWNKKVSIYRIPRPVSGPLVRQQLDQLSSNFLVPQQPDQLSSSFLVPQRPDQLPSGPLVPQQPDQFPSNFLVHQPPGKFQQDPRSKLILDRQVIFCRKKAARPLSRFLRQFQKIRLHIQPNPDHYPLQ